MTIPLDYFWFLHIAIGISFLSIYWIIAMLIGDGGERLKKKYNPPWFMAVITAVFIILASIFVSAVGVEIYKLILISRSWA